MSIDNDHIFKVSEFARLTRQLIETTFASVWVEGEISNFVCPNSGHWYFTLKDDAAQIRCAMFRMHNRTLKFFPENGMQVLVRAKASLYENRGDFQLIAEQIEEVGLGALQRAFEQLKTKLQKDGLFDESHKKSIPTTPQIVGVITSPTGAAIHDILTVLKRRAPNIHVIIYPTLVQGECAAEQIVNMIEIANHRDECDVLLLARGGGSLEDLWPFNEEPVARAIFKSHLPIVTGVGHEIDFTIADFVSDHRAPTPSAAAEFVSHDQQALLIQCKQYQSRLVFLMKQLFTQHQNNLSDIKNRLLRCHPLQKLSENMQRLDHLTHQLKQAQHQLIEHYQVRLQALARTLNAISPLATLDRGYSILKHKSGDIIRNPQQVHVGEKITATLAKGKLQCVVDAISE